MEHLLSIKEVAPLLGVTPYTVRKWVREGSIPHFRLSSRCIRFKRSDLDVWLSRQHQEIVKEEDISLANVVDIDGRSRYARSS